MERAENGGSIMTIVKYCRLKCDFCGKRSPEMEELYMPISWVKSNRKGFHFCSRLCEIKYLES